MGIITIPALLIFKISLPARCRKLSLNFSPCPRSVPPCVCTGPPGSASLDRTELCGGLHKNKLYEVLNFLQLPPGPQALRVALLRGPVESLGFPPPWFLLIIGRCWGVQLQAKNLHVICFFRSCCRKWQRLVGKAALPTADLVHASTLQSLKGFATKDSSPKLAMLSCIAGFLAQAPPFRGFFTGGHWKKLSPDASVETPLSRGGEKALKMHFLLLTWYEVLPLSYPFPYPLLLASVSIKQ